MSPIARQTRHPTHMSLARAPAWFTCEPDSAPDVFTLLDDGLAYVREGDKIYATAKGNPQGAEGMASFPESKLESVIESAEECPGECIFIEP